MLSVVMFNTVMLSVVFKMYVYICVCVYVCVYVCGVKLGDNHSEHHYAEYSYAECLSADSRVSSL